MSGHEREFTRRSERIEELVHRIEGSGDLATRAVAQELLQAVIELHGVALERILDAFAGVAAAEAALETLAGDPLVSGVLSLHGLHPVALERRVSASLEGVRPYLHSHGGDVELESIENGVVSLRMRGACGSCSSSSETMKRSVEEAIINAAPEISAVVAEQMPAAAQSTLVTLRAS